MNAANGALRGKSIVITGASSGFGRGAALAFADAGASVVLAARREQLPQAVARRVVDRVTFRDMLKLNGFHGGEVRTSVTQWA